MANLRNHALRLAVRVGASLLAGLIVSAQTERKVDMQSGYAPVNGLKMYFESHGKGDPLVLVHGGVVGITAFGGNVETLARNRRVIAVELQGHGHTADIGRPLAFEAMADDIAAFIKYLGLPRVDLMGYSLGGGVALQTAVRHPQVIARLIVVSAPCARQGMFPEVLAAMSRMGPEAGEMMKGSPLSKMYPGVNWATLFTKLGQLLSADYDWSKQVPAIKAPTMLVFADADAVRPEHIVEFYRLLGGGQRDAGQDGSRRSANQLAVIPGLTHYTISAAPALVAAVEPFLSTAPRQSQ
jgi:pimeloyl-ACP methyl ester carboxylesterase